MMTSQSTRLGQQRAAGQVPVAGRPDSRIPGVDLARCLNFGTVVWQDGVELRHHHGIRRCTPALLQVIRRRSLVALNMARPSRCCRSVGEVAQFRRSAAPGAALWVRGRLTFARQVDPILVRWSPLRQRARADQSQLSAKQAADGTFLNCSVGPSAPPHSDTSAALHTAAQGAGTGELPSSRSRAVGQGRQLAQDGRGIAGVRRQDSSRHEVGHQLLTVRQGAQHLYQAGIKGGWY